MWDLTIHPSSGPVSSLALVPFSNRCGIPPNPPPARPGVGTSPLMSNSLQVSASSLTHRPMFGTATASRYCPLWAFPSKFFKRVSHPYKRCFVLLPIQRGISQSSSVYTNFNGFYFISNPIFCQISSILEQKHTATPTTIISIHVQIKTDSTQIIQKQNKNNTTIQFKNKLNNKFSNKITLEYEPTP